MIRFKTFLLRALLVLCGLGWTFFSEPIWAAEGERLKVDQKLAFFERPECQIPFAPDSLKNFPDVTEAYTKLLNHFVILRKKLPQVADYLSSFFKDGRILWCFTDEEIPVVFEDHGFASLGVRFEKTQAAVNIEDIVTIVHPVWDKMSVDLRVALMLLEVLYSAVDPLYTEDGEDLQLLTQLFLHPQLASLSRPNLVRFIERQIPFEESPLLVALRRDLRTVTYIENFKVEEIQGELGQETIVSVLADNNLNGMQISTLNPSDSLRHTIVDKYRRLYIDIGSDGKQVLHRIKADLLCEKQTLGGKEGWRLPSSQELLLLEKLGLFSTRFDFRLQSSRKLDR